MKGSSGHWLKVAVQRLAEKAPPDLIERFAAAPSWLRSGIALGVSIVLVLLIGSIGLCLAAPPARHIQDAPGTDLPAFSLDLR